MAAQYPQRRRAPFRKKPFSKQFKSTRRITQKVRRRSSKIDLRGRHTKASRAQKRLEHERFMASLDLYPTCSNCSGVEFVPTTDGDTYACTGCGLLSESRIIEGVTDVSTVCNRSAGYDHRNYVAERLRQACGRDPAFTESEKNKITVLYGILGDLQVHRSGVKAGFGFLGSCKSFSKYRFRQICQLLDKLEPGRRWKQKLEKWLQARQVIFGTLKDLSTLDDWHCMMLKVLFDPVGCYFDQHFRKNERGSHNIPKIDLILLVLLYNISEESLARYGWYFLSKNIVWPTKSTLDDYQRIDLLLDKINLEFLKMPKKKNVRTQSYVWLRKNNYTVPDLDYLVHVAACSQEGHWMVNQLQYHGDPHYDVQYVLDGE